MCSQKILATRFFAPPQKKIHTKTRRIFFSKKNSADNFLAQKSMAHSSAEKISCAALFLKRKKWQLSKLILPNNVAAHTA